MDEVRQFESIVTLMTSHQQRLMVYIRSLVPHRADAEEVAQDVNLFIWRHANEFQPGTDFAAWALRIAHFHVLTYRKKQARNRVRLSDAVINQLAEQSVVLSGQIDRRHDALKTCMQKLPPKDRELIALRYEIGATTKSVADRTGRSLKAIYEALGRIRTRLLECVDRTLTAEERSS